jgi:hypothetical protein
MGVIKSLEKTYLLKNDDVPEYYLGVNMESLGNSWKNQRLGVGLSANTLLLGSIWHQEKDI